MRAASLVSRICVYCGASAGSEGAFAQAARELARVMAAHGLELVYGGGSVGMMGALADAMLESGGRVIGVIPEALARRELAHPRASEMHVVPDICRRKAKMTELADAFVALQGGLGTLEELTGALTAVQLGMHAKPVGVLNVGGYFDHLLALVEHAAVQGFIAPADRGVFVVAESPRDLLERMGVLGNGREP